MKHLLPDFGDLSLEEQVAQLLVVRVSGHLFDHQVSQRHGEPSWDELKGWLKDVAIGGVILAEGSAGEISLRTQELQDSAKVPLLIAADVEAGVGQRFLGATAFPPAMALGDIARRDLSQAKHFAFLMGQYTAQEVEAIGLNWLLAPVMDVNSNPLNPIINVRSFGNSPELVSELAIAFIKGAQQHAVLTTAKHFPGHGDTTVDSHFALPVLNHDRARLDAVELPPFKAAIAAGVDGVMTGHLQVPALDKLYPATLSDRVVTKFLRQELGFEGLIVTDSLVMKAIADHYDPNEAAVLAMEAGADILMMPADPMGAIQAICDAVEEGRISADQIQSSVERVWRAKERVTTFGVDPEMHQHAWEQQMPSPIQLEAIAQPTVRQCPIDILTQSNQMRGTIAHLDQPQRSVIVLNSARNAYRLAVSSPCVSLPEARGYDIQRVDPYSALRPELSEADAGVPTLLQIFVQQPPSREDKTEPLWKIWFDFLIDHQMLQGLVVFGNPDVLKHCLEVLPQSTPYGFSYGQFSEAQALLLTALFDDTV